MSVSDDHDPSFDSLALERLSLATIEERKCKPMTSLSLERSNEFIRHAIEKGADYGRPIRIRFADHPPPEWQGRQRQGSLRPDSVDIALLNDHSFSRGRHADWEARNDAAPSGVPAPTGSAAMEDISSSRFANRIGRTPADERAFPFLGQESTKSAASPRYVHVRERARSTETHRDVRVGRH